MVPTHLHYHPEVYHAIKNRALTIKSRSVNGVLVGGDVTTAFINLQEIPNGIENEKLGVALYAYSVSVYYA